MLGNFLQGNIGPYFVARALLNYIGFNICRSMLPINNNCFFSAVIYCTETGGKGLLKLLS